MGSFTITVTIQDVDNAFNLAQALSTANVSGPA